MRRLAPVVALAIVSLTAAPAFAAADFPTVNFNFQGNQGQQSSLNFTDPDTGLTVTATGHLQSTQQVDVYQAPWGLGVVDTTTNSNLNVQNYLTHIINGDSVNVDGAGNPEFLRLSFDKEVWLRSVQFAKVGPFDRLDLHVDGQDIDVEDFGPLGTDRIFFLPPFDFFKGNVDVPDTVPSGKTFDLLAVGKLSDWKVEKISAEIIPEPTTLLIWSSLGLGLLGWRHRRRRR